MDETGAMDGDLPLTAGGKTVLLTQKDIRQLQLAKGAFAAGLEVLLSRAGITEAEIGTVYLAGGFGTHLSPVSAGRIGLLPPVLARKTVSLGNAALAGACMLLRTDTRKKAKEIASSAVHIPLGGSEEFNNAFVEHMLFE